MRVGVLAAIVLTLSGCRGGRPPDASPVAADRRLNILLVVADDLGFTDLGAYGSEIRTPVIDTLAARGRTFSRFRASATCSPSRASLMSGVDPHVAGLGNMFEDLAPNQKGQPGYEGHLNFAVAPLPAVLKAAGYRTYMAGKWHLGRDEATSPAARGFDRSFALLGGGSSHFAERRVMEGEGQAAYRDDGRLVERLPDDFYSTRSFADRLIEYIGAHPPDDAAPYFAYLAFSAPHFPLQAPDDSIAATAASTTPATSTCSRRGSPRPSASAWRRPTPPAMRSTQGRDGGPRSPPPSAPSRRAAWRSTRPWSPTWTRRWDA